MYSQTSRADKHHPGHLFLATLPIAAEVPRAPRKGKVRKARILEGHSLPEAKSGYKEATSQTAAVIRQIHLHCGRSTCFPALKAGCKLPCDLGLSGAVTAEPDSFWDGRITCSYPNDNATSVFGVCFLIASQHRRHLRA